MNMESELELAEFLNIVNTTAAPLPVFLPGISYSMSPLEAEDDQSEKDMPFIFNTYHLRYSKFSLTGLFLVKFNYC